MQKCSYCGRQNGDASHSCSECVTSLAEPPVSIRTPHHVMREIQQSIWEHFALKRRQFYLAGFFIGAFGALVASLHHIKQGIALWSFPVGGAFGVGAVWFLSFAEILQARIHKARAEGKPTGARRALFVIFGLIVLLFKEFEFLLACDSQSRTPPS